MSERRKPSKRKPRIIGRGGPGNPDKVKPYQFQPGKSGNPGGKPVGSRNKLQGDFVRALSDDFEKYGAKAIKRCRETKPADYVRVIASLLPKEVDVRNPTDGLSDDDLATVIAACRVALGLGESGSNSEPSQVPTTTH